MAKQGKKGAIAGVIAEAAAADATAIEPRETVQLDLIPTRFDPGDSRHEKLVEAIKRDKRGRPPGAENITTRQMKAFVLKVFGDPLLKRFRWLEHTPETMAAELGCTKLEAWDRLDRLAAELSRLFYGTMAPVDGDGNAVVPRLTMTFGGHDAQPIGPDGQRRPPWKYLDAHNDQTQQNQGLIDVTPAPSHGQPSHRPE